MNNMKKTNYTKVAHKYDHNQYRKDEIRFDVHLKEYVECTRKNEYNVLDLSCGTGLYLEKQMSFFEGKGINWNGLDASKEMLELAERRLENVSLVKAYAEEMPYEDGVFDFIVNNFALHHYVDKGQALDEVDRVLTTGGIYKLHNIAIYDMPKWWVYYYFPTAFYEDLKRFWNKEVIFHELTTRGFEVNLHIEYQMSEIKVADLLNYAVNRDISVLTLIDDGDYEEGLKRMKNDLSSNSNKTIINDFAEMFCVAKKR